MFASLDADSCGYLTEKVGGEGGCCCRSPAMMHSSSRCISQPTVCCSMACSMAWAMAHHAHQLHCVPYADGQYCHDSLQHWRHIGPQRILTPVPCCPSLPAGLPGGLRCPGRGAHRPRAGVRHVCGAQGRGGPHPLQGLLRRVHLLGEQPGQMCVPQYCLKYRAAVASEDSSDALASHCQSAAGQLAS